MELEYNRDTYTVDGHDHYFANFTKYGEPLITDGRKTIDTKLSKFRMATLDKNNKKLIVLKDRVFTRRFIHVYITQEISIPVAILHGLASIGFLIAFIILNGQTIAPLFLTLFIVFMVVGVSIVVLRFILNSILKKPRF